MNIPIHRFNQDTGNYTTTHSIMETTIQEPNETRDFLRRDSQRMAKIMHDLLSQPTPQYLLRLRSRKETPMPRKAKEDKHDDVFAWPQDMMAGDDVPKMFEDIRKAHFRLSIDPPKIVLRIEGDPVDWKTRVTTVPKAICSVMSWARKLVTVDWAWWQSAEDHDRLREVHTVLARLNGEKPVEIIPSVARARGIDPAARKQLNLFPDEDTDRQADIEARLEEVMGPLVDQGLVQRDVVISAASG